MQTRKIIKVVLIVLLAVFIGIIALGAGYYFYLNSKIDSSVAGSIPQEFQTQKPTVDASGNKPSVQNILAVGIVYQNDQEKESQKGLTDVMLYINMVTDAQGVVKANILQIPRDTYVGAEKSKSGKLNTVYANGENQTDLIANLATRIYEDFKLPIDDYVIIDMDACKDIIDSMGGITMYVPWEIFDPKAPEKGVGEGWQHINGDTAEFIVRQRNMYSQKDFKRLELQQYFYKAVFQTVRNDFPITEAPLMANKALHYSKTDMNLAELMGLCAKGIKLKDENIFIMRMPGGALTVDIPNMKEPQSVYGVNAEKLAPLLNEHFRHGSLAVPASEMGILTGFEYKLGETYDEGKTMANVETPAK